MVTLPCEVCVMDLEKLVSSASITCEFRAKHCDGQCCKLMKGLMKGEALWRCEEVVALIQDAAGSLLGPLFAMVHLTTDMISLRNRRKTAVLLGKQVVCVFGCFQEVVGGWMRTTMKKIERTC